MQKIIFYDGDCGLCQRSIAFIWKRDPQGIFHFASIQSSIGRALLSEHGIPAPTLDTLYLLDDKGIRCRSDAVIRIARHLKGWRWAGFLLKMCPKAWRDWLYNQVARNRFRLSKQHSCPLPPPEIRQRFLFPHD